VSAAIVIDLGGTHVRLGHLTEEGVSPRQQAVPTEALRRAEPIGFLAETVRSYGATQGIRVSSVVLGVPFTPDRERTTALSSPNIPNLEGVPLKHALAEALGCEVTLERDINLLLLGEWRAGAAQGVGAAFGMFVGTGVGGSMLLDGVPYRGATGAALELGHIPIRAEGRRCVCGNTDCLEAYACGHTLRALAERHGLDLPYVFVKGDQHPAAPELDAFVRDLACALATGVNLFHPELALVGGGIPEMPGFPKGRFEEIFYAHLRRPVPAETVKLVWARLGSRASLYGAQALLRREAHA